MWYLKYPFRGHQAGKKVEIEDFDGNIRFRFTNGEDESSFTPLGQNISMYLTHSKEYVRNNNWSRIVRYVKPEVTNSSHDLTGSLVFMDSRSCERCQTLVGAQTTCPEQFVDVHMEKGTLVYVAYNYSEDLFRIVGTVVSISDNGEVLITTKKGNYLIPVWYLDILPSNYMITKDDTIKYNNSYHRVTKTTESSALFGKGKRVSNNSVQYLHRMRRAKRVDTDRPYRGLAFYSYEPRIEEPTRTFRGRHLFYIEEINKFMPMDFYASTEDAIEDFSEYIFVPKTIYLRFCENILPSRIINSLEYWVYKDDFIKLPLFVIDAPSEGKEPRPKPNKLEYRSPPSFLTSSGRVRNKVNSLRLEKRGVACVALNKEKDKELIEKILNNTALKTYDRVIKGGDVKVLAFPRSIKNRIEKMK